MEKFNEVVSSSCTLEVLLHRQLNTSHAGSEMRPHQDTASPGEELVLIEDLEGQYGQNVGISGDIVLI